MPNVTLSITRRIKNHVHFVTASKPAALKIYTNWDVAVGAGAPNEITVPWTATAIPMNYREMDSRIASLRGRYFFDLKIDSYPAISDAQTFYVRLVRADSTTEDMICVLPVEVDDSPIFLIHGTAPVSELWIPFGRTGQSISLVNMSATNNLSIRLVNGAKSIVIPPQADWSESGTLTGVFLEGLGAPVEVEGSLSLTTSGD